MDALDMELCDESISVVSRTTVHDWKKHNGVA